MITKNKGMKRFFAGVLMVFVFLSTYAATEFSGVIRGKVIDSNTKEALQFVNISIKKKGTAVPVKATVTDQTGSFTLGSIGVGDYIVSVSYIGYKSFEKDFSITPSSNAVNLKMITLAEDSKMLQEVQVVGQKSQMKFEIDKKVFNVDQNIASTGGSASDVLSNIPSVDVNNEGEVSLRGSSSVTIWINGKASGLSADNRAQILEQMPAESIEKIEVITNPSAKYSPEGTAGIINIVLKEDRKAGYYGSVQAGVDTRGGYNGSYNINYSSKKLDSYANIGYRDRERTGGGYSNRTYTNDNSYLNQTTDTKGANSNTFFRAGLTYHLTSDDDLSLGGFGMFGNRTENKTLNYTSNIINSYDKSLRLSDTDNSMNGGNVELGYKHEFSKTSDINFTASFNRWSMDNTSIYNQTSHYTTGNETSTFQKQIGDMSMNNWEFQIDYQNAINDNNKIEAGYKGTLGRNKSPVETYSGTTDQNSVPDYTLFNRFLYNQDIHALYATYSGKVSRFGYQLGLRGEYSKVDTKSYAHDGTGDPFKKDYFSLFPSAFISYTLPGNNELQINYTRRISRPWGPQLNSFRNITDSTNISYGNPQLSPEYSNSFELNYIKNWENHMLSVSGYYRTTDDVIQQVSFLDENQVMNTTSMNIAKTQSAGTELVLKNKLFTILDLTSTLNLFYYKLNGFDYTIGESTILGKPQEDFSWNTRIIANLILPYSTSFQITGNYNAKQAVAQGTNKANYSVDAGIRKSFMNKKLSLSISARDLLDSRKSASTTSGTGFVQNAENWHGGRQIGFTLTYSFGNMRGKNNKSKKPTETNSNMAEPMGEEF